MTIQYLKQKFPPPPFDVDVEQMQYFRDLYDGNHENIFPRAQELAKQSQQITKPKMSRARKRYYKGYASQNKGLAQYHYVVVNFAPVIAELPADLLNRALGNISADTENNKDLLEFIPQVVKRSNVQQKIWATAVQHQVDGGVAYRIRRDENGTWFEWKLADLYFEHEDGLGADVAWIEERGEQKFLRVERQRLTNNQLAIEQLVFELGQELVEKELDIKAYEAEFELAVPENQTLKLDELMCGFIPNDETLLHPRGRSGLRNIDGIQEEINWTITRDSIVFEKHGKPKLAIPKALWDSVAKTNQTYYGERFVRNADLEVVSYNEQNGAVPMYITWDAKTERSFEHVKRLIEYMMAVSKTSPQAVGMKEAKGESGIALLYLWIQSVIKAESIKDKFDSGIKDAIRKCILLENVLGGTNYPVVEPVVEWGDMLPKAESERDKEESDKYEKGVQSLETTIRNIHPDWSEKAIQEEVKKILEQQAVDSLSPVFTQPPKTTVTGDDE
jgi:hypothetical protein